MISKDTLKGYGELTKPRILLFVLITTTLGYFLGAKGISSLSYLTCLLSGVALVCGGAAALNHYLERDVDSRMERTKRRPIPSGLIPAVHALIFGILLVLSGVILLCWKINLLTAFLGLLTAFLYVLVYTPLKRVSWFNTTIGAVPGALPPVGGWAAATGELSTGAWAIFFLLFIWQHPHFYAIAWMFREDYRRGGLRMLPVLYPDGQSTFSQIKAFTWLLIPVSLFPTWIGMSGYFYFWGALLLGMLFLKQSLRAAASRSHQDARRVLKASILYLPLIFLLIVFDAALI
jgi:protoheme IX farnesyltransferase